MPSTVTITDRDTGFARIEIDLLGLRSRKLRVGITGDEKVDGVSVVDYAFYNEFGTSRGIPARPFMATTYDRYHAKTEKFIEYMYGQMLEGKMTPDHLLKTAGMEYQKRVQETIRDAKKWAVPNAESTIERKGSTSPLIDTGRMIGAVRYEIT